MNYSVFSANISFMQHSFITSCSTRNPFTAISFRWYHLCSSPGVLSAPPSLSTSMLGKNLVRLPTFLPAGTDQSAPDPIVTRRVQSLPVIREATPTQCQLTPLDVAILNNKNAVMTELAQVTTLGSYKVLSYIFGRSCLFV